MADSNNHNNKQKRTKKDHRSNQSNQYNQPNQKTQEEQQEHISTKQQEKEPVDFKKVPEYFDDFAKKAMIEYPDISLESKTPGKHVIKFARGFYFDCDDTGEIVKMTIHGGKMIIADRKNVVISKKNKIVKSVMTISFWNLFDKIMRQDDKRTDALQVAFKW
jgi:hypothetical protein